MFEVVAGIPWSGQEMYWNWIIWRFSWTKFNDAVSLWSHNIFT